MSPTTLQGQPAGFFIRVLARLITTTLGVVVAVAVGWVWSAVASGEWAKPKWVFVGAAVGHLIVSGLHPGRRVFGLWVEADAGRGQPQPRPSPDDEPAVQGYWNSRHAAAATQTLLRCAPMLLAVLVVVSGVGAVNTIGSARPPSPAEQSDFEAGRLVGSVLAMPAWAAVPLYVGCLFAFGRRRQTLHDWLARAVVMVRSRTG